MTPGIRSTEFWLSLAALAFNALIAGGAIPNATEVGNAVAAVAAALVAFGYTWARAFTKARLGN